MRRIALTFGFVMALFAASGPGSAYTQTLSDITTESSRALPSLLSDTGLFETGTLTVRKENLAYAPQYPLWSDGATKRRWIYLPPGTAIDATDPDAWVFPPGTRFWKEFAYSGPIETRMIERLADGSWRYVAYVWNEEGSDAVLAPDSGFRRHRTALSPSGYYTIPSRDDCRACHEGNAVPILGFSALQLSPERDRNSPNAEPKPQHAVDLPDAVARKLVTNLAADYVSNPPRIAVSSETARAALGYLHANCGHCHNAAGPLNDLDFDLFQSVAGGATGVEKMQQALLGAPSDFHLYGATQRVVPGQPASSVLVLRMASRNPLAQMPPLGTRAVDTQAMLLVERWIQELH